jgi:hypothetical protein
LTESFTGARLAPTHARRTTSRASGGNRVQSNSDHQSGGGTGRSDQHRSDLFRRASEPVFNFIESDISFAGSTVGGTLVASAVLGSGTTYTVTVNGMAGNGTVVASIPAGAALNFNGDPNEESTSTDSTVNFFTVVPTVTVNQAAGQADPTNNGPIFFDVVFSAPVTGFNEADISFAGSTVGGTCSRR